MRSSSPFARVAATQTPTPTRKEQVATLAGRVEERVGNVRRALVNNSSRGFASELATAMGWRIERRSRELSGTEKLSLADVLAEIKLHLIYGEEEQAEAILSALLDDLGVGAMPLKSGSVYHVFDKNGQLFVRFGQ